MIESRVIPSRIAPGGGVTSLPRRTTKMFSPVHSATMPCPSSMIASSNPRRSDSVFASTEFG